MQEKSNSGERSVVISLQNEERKYLSGHIIDGRNLFPAVGYLVSCRLRYLTNIVMGFPCISYHFIYFVFGRSKKGYNPQDIEYVI